MLTDQMQMQAIVDWLFGKAVERPVESFQPIMRTAWLALRRFEQPGLDDAEWREEVLDGVLAEMQLHHGREAEPLRDALREAVTGAGLASFPSLAEIAGGLPPVTWLWPDWLPIGMLSLLAARPGTGKSLLALDLARRITAGEDWPDGSVNPRPGANVIYVEAENVPQILNERAERWQMERDKLFLLLPDEGDVIIDLSSEKYQDKLSWMTYRLRPALIVIDSLGSCMGRGENSVEDVRQIMGYFSFLAMHYGCSLLMIHHLRKGGGQMALLDSVDMDQIRGSGHLAAMARVAWGLTTVQTGPDPDRNGPRKLEVIKTNLGAYPEALGITLEPLHPEGVRLAWSEKAPKRYQEPTQRDDAAEWLLAYLEDHGPTRPKEVIDAAEQAGYGRAMIYRARKQLSDEITNTAGRRHPQNMWALGDDARLLSQELQEFINLRDTPDEGAESA